MKATYGLEVANRNFITQWQQQGLGANPLDARSFNTRFRDYAKANGFFDALYYGLGVLAQPIGATVGAGTSVINAAESAINTTASISKYVLPVAALFFAWTWYNGALLKRH